MIGIGVGPPQRHDHAKPEGRLRAADDDLILSDSKWDGADEPITADF